MNEFKQFDMVSDDSDHHFRDRSNGNNITSPTHKSIMKEWKFLEQNLPESIYVRVYEQRIDLMRAVIIGVPGTPYHDGLFFFDIAFPSDYPNKPPELHFISFGHQLSPHLYNNGKVCVSLLNTLKGPSFLTRKCEKWNPYVSTCLQILLSIQAIILRENPYYFFPFSRALNEDFNEDVYCLTCKLTLHLIKSPPKNFNTFVKSHFRDRAPVILAAFIAYATGRVRIRYYGVGGGEGKVVSVSRSYKRWAQEIYPHMIKAFERCGASLDTSVRTLVLNEESSILTKVIAQIKKAFTWKKN